MTPLPSPSSREQKCVCGHEKRLHVGSLKVACMVNVSDAFFCDCEEFRALPDCNCGASYPGEHFGSCPAYQPKGQDSSLEGLLREAKIKEWLWALNAAHPSEHDIATEKRINFGGVDSGRFARIGGALVELAEALPRIQAALTDSRSRAERVEQQFNGLRSQIQALPQYWLCPELPASTAYLKQVKEGQWLSRKAVLTLLTPDKP